MSIDRYTKIILTVIALSLVVMAAQHLVKPAFGDPNSSCNEFKSNALETARYSNAVFKKLSDKSSDKKLWQDTIRWNTDIAANWSNVYTAFCKP
ncbi:MAG: hypothetical protein CMM55_06455 [Rhodospirillaceae bacterium]|nr:hypothetical protein [Rhodospirillaceae bacterium]|tara:strand:- start:1509 stop:1790 length:282 start_codon:yes stop_codon:yes gene_type:complete